MGSLLSWLGRVGRRSELTTKWHNDIGEAEGALADRRSAQESGDDRRAADATAKLHVVMRDIDTIHEELDE